MYEISEYGNDKALGHICESVHENANIVNSPVRIEDNRTINPDQRIVNPVIINLHIHVNEIPADSNGFVKKIIGGLLNALKGERHATVDSIERLSTSDIQGRIIRELGNG